MNRIKIEDKTFFKRFEVFRSSNRNRITMRQRKYKIHQYYTTEGSRYEVLDRNEVCIGVFKIDEIEQSMYSTDLSEEDLLLIVKGIENVICSYYIPLKYDGYSSLASYIEEAVNQLQFNNVIIIGDHKVAFELNRVTDTIGEIRIEARTTNVDMYNMQMILQYQYYDNCMHIFWYKTLVKSKEKTYKIYYKFLIALCSLIQYQYINCLISVKRIPF